MNNEMNIESLQSKDFAENLLKAETAGFLSNCAICGKHAPTAKVAVLFHTGYLDVVTTDYTTPKEINELMAGSPMGFWPVGSNCARRHKAALGKFLRPMPRY